LDYLNIVKQLKSSVTVYSIYEYLYLVAHTLKQEGFKKSDVNSEIIDELSNIFITSNNEKVKELFQFNLMYIFNYSLNNCKIRKSEASKEPVCQSHTNVLPNHTIVPKNSTDSDLNIDASELSDKKYDEEFLNMFDVEHVE
jgi:hypothetical protein